MNLPNKLIIFRILMIPFFLYFFLTEQPFFRMIALLIFLVAAVSDFFDGLIARKWNMVTNFGKLMDPLADKMLVSSALVALVYTRELTAWVVVVIICREFWVTALRILALEQGEEPPAASLWGKAKTVLQMAMLSCLIWGIGEVLGPTGVLIADILIYLTVIATLGSAFDYTRGFIKVIKA